MPLSFTIDFTPSHGDLREFGKGAVPRWFHRGRTAEELEAFVKQFVLVKQLMDDWHRMGFVKWADGRWLEHHAWEQGTEKQANEGQEALRARLRRIEDHITRPAILAAVQRVMDAAGAPGTVGMVELRKDRAYFDRQAFFDRGYRMGSQRPAGFIVILPPGTPEAVRVSVHEAVRQRKAGGFFHAVEVQP